MVKFESKRKRMEMLLSKMAPLIIRDGPSQKTTYKMQAKNLHCEIFPLNQRIRLVQMRAEHEQIKRKAVEFEVRQLRDQISDLHIRISRATVGVPINQTMLMTLEEHKEKWAQLCDMTKTKKQQELEEARLAAQGGEKPKKRRVRKASKPKKSEPEKGGGEGFASVVIGLLALVKRKRLEKEANEKKAALEASENGTEVNEKTTEAENRTDIDNIAPLQDISEVGNETKANEKNLNSMEDSTVEVKKSPKKKSKVKNKSPVKNKTSVANKKVVKEEKVKS